MTKKKIKKLLQEHPYLIDSAFVRSRSEAILFANENDVTIEDFIERARNSSSLPTSSWDVFTEAIARKHDRKLQKNEVLKPDIISTHNTMPRSLRRAVAVLIAIVILTGFFTMTKPGIAMAQAVYRIVVVLLNGQLIAQQNMPPDDISPIDFENIPKQFESLEQAARLIGRPVASIEYEDAVLVDISTNLADGIMVMLKTQYQINDSVLYLTQVFYDGVTSWGSVVGTDAIELITELQDGNVMYIGYMHDGTVYGNAYSKSYNISVTSNDIDARKLSDVVMEMRFIE